MTFLLFFNYYVLSLLKWINLKTILTDYCSYVHDFYHSFNIRFLIFSQTMWFSEITRKPDLGIQLILSIESGVKKEEVSANENNQWK